MRIKKFNNLWTMGVVLALGLLIAIYVLKFFFPEIVIEVAQIDSICRIGHYIDTHKWAWYLASFIISYISYFFICCACSNRKCLVFKEYVIVFVGILLVYVSKEISLTLYTVLNYISMIMLPYLTQGRLKNIVVSFTTLNLLQFLTLSIRNLNTMVTDFNFATAMVLVLDVYIFELLLYFLYNFKKEV